jgi:hypothetical protein
MFDITTLSMREGERGPEAEARALGSEKGIDNETWGRRECEPSRSFPLYSQRSRRESSSLFFRAIVKTV